MIWDVITQTCRHSNVTLLALQVSVEFRRLIMALRYDARYIIKQSVHWAPLLTYYQQYFINNQHLFNT